MNRQNYLIYSYVGLKPRAMIREVVVMDTDAGYSFVRKDLLQSEVWTKLHVPSEVPHV